MIELKSQMSDLEANKRIMDSNVASSYLHFKFLTLLDVENNHLAFLNPCLSAFYCSCHLLSGVAKLTRQIK
jgi:hypothetical protein